MLALALLHFLAEHLAAESLHPFALGGEITQILGTPAAILQELPALLAGVDALACFVGLHQVLLDLFEQGDHLADLVEDMAEPLPEPLLARSVQLCGCDPGHPGLSSIQSVSFMRELLPDQEIDQQSHRRHQHQWH